MCVIGNLLNASGYFSSVFNLINQRRIVTILDNLSVLEESLKAHCLLFTFTYFLKKFQTY